MMNFYKMKLLRSTPKCKYKTPGSTVTLAEVQGHFLWLSVGIAISVVVLAIEIVHQKLQSSKDRLQYQDSNSEGPESISTNAPGFIESDKNV